MVSQFSSNHLLSYLFFNWFWISSLSSITFIYILGSALNYTSCSILSLFLSNLVQITYCFNFVLYITICVNICVVSPSCDFSFPKYFWFSSVHVLPYECENHFVKFQKTVLSVFIGIVNIKLNLWKMGIFVNIKSSFAGLWFNF